MKTFAALASLALGACVADSGAWVPYRGPLAAEGTAVALGQTVALAEAALTPMRVIEDSRCPTNARCVWAGRIVVETRVDGPGWRETVQLELGEPQRVRDLRMALVSAEPNRATQDAGIEPGEYRFVYEGGSTGVSGD